MNNLFDPEKRKLIAEGIVRAFSISFGALLVADFVWEGPLKLKFGVGTMLLALLVGAWIICPPKAHATKEESN